MGKKKQPKMMSLSFLGNPRVLSSSKTCSNPSQSTRIVKPTRKALMNTSNVLSIVSRETLASLMFLALGASASFNAKSYAEDDCDYNIRMGGMQNAIAETFRNNKLKRYGDILSRYPLPSKKIPKAKSGDRCPNAPHCNYECTGPNSMRKHLDKKCKENKDNQCGYRATPESYPCKEIVGIDQDWTTNKKRRQHMKRKHPDAPKARRRL